MAPLTLPDRFATGDVVLRLPEETDVERITTICRDPDVQRFTNVPVPYRAEDARGFVEVAARSLADGSGAHLVVERGGVLVGAVGAGIDPADASANAGYWTAPDARRQGVTTAAMRRFCRWLLDDIGLARIEMHAAASNRGSNAVAARLGFTHEGTRRRAFVLSAVDDAPAVRDDANVWGLLPGELV